MAQRQINQLVDGVQHVNDRDWQLLLMALDQALDDCECCLVSGRSTDGVTTLGGGAIEVRASGNVYIEA